MNSSFSELKRRNVVRVAVAYVVVSWVILQFVDIVEPIIKILEAELGIKTPEVPESARQ